jgi:hypothetical protein
MGLFNQFVSAAVRQVGRDGGKVISNKIYGNSHTSRVSIVNENGQYNSSKEVYSYADQGLKKGILFITAHNILSYYLDIGFG